MKTLDLYSREKSKNKQIHQKVKTENSESFREKSKNKQIHQKMKTLNRINDLNFRSELETNTNSEISHCRHNHFVPYLAFDHSAPVDPERVHEHQRHQKSCQSSSLETWCRNSSKPVQVKQ